MEEIAHRVNEDQARSLPSKRDRQTFRPELEIEALLVRVRRYAPKSLSERLGIAVCAARAYLVAAGDWVPGGVRPLDPAVVGHGGDDSGRIRIRSVQSVYCEDWLS